MNMFENAKKPSPVWGAHELQLLREHYLRPDGPQYLSQELGRSISALYTKAYKLGLSGTHKYSGARARWTLSKQERFEQKIERIPESGCWIWTGTVNAKGYGNFDRDGAHRQAWEIYYGEIPKGLCILHRCDVAPCVNPQHLFLGTIADNNKDMFAKGRFVSGHKKKTHCKYGHEFSEDNTYIYRGKYRHCRACALARFYKKRDAA